MFVTNVLLKFVKLTNISVLYYMEDSFLYNKRERGPIYASIFSFKFSQTFVLILFSSNILLSCYELPLRGVIRYILNRYNEVKSQFPFHWTMKRCTCVLYLFHEGSSSYFHFISDGHSCASSNRPNTLPVKLFFNELSYFHCYRR